MININTISLPAQSNPSLSLNPDPLLYEAIPYHTLERGRSVNTRLKRIFLGGRDGQARMRST
jgi:hypothetical protein